MEFRAIKISNYNNVNDLICNTQDSDLSMVVDCFEIVECFITWQLDTKNFNSLLFVAKESRWGKPQDRSSFPKICSNEDEIHNDKQRLGKLAAKGYTIIFSSKSNMDDILKFFEEFHYTPPNEGSSEIRSSMFFKDDVNTKALGATLKEAFSLGGETFCCFGHDSDPVYLFSPA